MKPFTSGLIGCLLVSLSVAVGLVALPSLAQDEGLTFEQAQTRTSYARSQMEKKRRELKKAETEEEVALRSAEDLKRRYDAAIKEAEAASKARQDAEQAFAQARETWLEEARRLKRIHQSRELTSPER